MTIESDPLNRIVARGIKIATNFKAVADRATKERADEQVIEGLNATARAVALMHLLVGGKVYYELRIQDEELKGNSSKDLLGRLEEDLGMVDDALGL